MNTKWRNWPVIVKMTLTTTVLVVLAVLAVTLLSIAREQNSFRSELEHHAELMLDSLSVTAAVPLYFLQRDTLRELVRGLVEAESVASICFYDGEGRPLAGSSLSRETIRASDTIDPLGHGLLSREEIFLTWHPDYLNAGRAVRVAGQELGAISISLSTASLETKVAAVRNQGLGVALLALAAAALLAMLNSRSMVSPLAQLVDATQRIAGGDLEHRIAVASHDEFGMLASSFNEMTVRLQEQTVELRDTHEELLRKQRLATLGELAGSIAHEIRNPLAAMKSSIYFLRMTQKLVDEKAMEHLTGIDTQIDRSNRIITELLDYAREPRLAATCFVLQDAVERALAELEVPSTVCLDRRIEACPLMVRADPGQTEQILGNLLRNAVQAMPDARGKLGVECQLNDDQAIVTITDNGVGIAAENLSKVFEPLYTSKMKGIGLGLAVSQRYARLNGGRIECESEPGKGTAFRLVLPPQESERGTSGRGGDLHFETVDRGGNLHVETVDRGGDAVAEREVQ